MDFIMSTRIIPGFSQIANASKLTMFKFLKPDEAMIVPVTTTVLSFAMLRKGEEIYCYGFDPRIERAEDAMARLQIEADKQGIRCTDGTC